MDGLKSVCAAQAELVQSVGTRASEMKCAEKNDEVTDTECGGAISALRATRPHVLRPLQATQRRSVTSAACHQQVVHRQVRRREGSQALLTEAFGVSGGTSRYRYGPKVMFGLPSCASICDTSRLRGTSTSDAKKAHRYFIERSGLQHRPQVDGVSTTGHFTDDMNSNHRR
jgi:hypothetical protein